MATLYFGFGLSDGMFNGDLNIRRKDLKDDGGYADYLLRNPQAVFADQVGICLNPAHKATIDAMVAKYGISGIEIPDEAVQIKMQPGDSLLVMSPRGLPRLVDRHEYTDAEVANATFNFAVWTVED